MTTQNEALKMAIEALQDVKSAWRGATYYDKAINACKEALQSQEQKPVAWYWDNNHRDKIPYVGVERGNPKMDDIFGTPIPLYTHPKEWQELSDDEIQNILDNSVYCEVDAKPFARAILAKAKEKNYG